MNDQEKDLQALLDKLTPKPSLAEIGFTIGLKVLELLVTGFVIGVGFHFAAKLVH